MHEPGVVELDGDRIGHVGPTTGTAPARTLVPGFVDLQVNGLDDVDVATATGADWDRLDGLLAASGVTTWCPTLVSAPLDAYAAPLSEIARAAARGGARPAIAGAHLEGPFLGQPIGAHRPEHVVTLDRAWLAALPDVVKVVTLAPELAGAPDAIATLLGRNTLVALGHTAATPADVDAAVCAGARLVTHLFNGMPPLHHREPGVVGAALTDDRLVVSLIADLVHVHPTALRLARRAKGPDGVALVTDAVAWRLPATGGMEIRLQDGAARLTDGTLAGSALTMDAAVRNVVEHAGFSVVDAVRAAASTPARLLGLVDRGQLAAGARADVVALDDEGRVDAVWIGGDAVVGS